MPATKGGRVLTGGFTAIGSELLGEIAALEVPAAPAEASRGSGGLGCMAVVGVGASPAVGKPQRG